MTLLGEDVLRTERRRFLTLIESLSDEDYLSGRTLCSEWAPKDVLAHLVGTNDIGRYLRNGLRINAVNTQAVAELGTLSRPELTARGHAWADRPSVGNRILARGLLGDVCVHYQDVTRGLGRPHDMPMTAKRAVLREGVLLSAGSKRRSVLRNRVVPTDGGRPIGRGAEVRGPTLALGLWLAGRRGVDTELEFRAP